MSRCWRARDGDDVVADAVKLLGCHVGMDGGTRTDTTTRKSAAAMAWATIRAMRVKLDLSLRGRILEAVVLSTLFYCARMDEWQIHV